MQQMQLVRKNQKPSINYFTSPKSMSNPSQLENGESSPLILIYYNIRGKLQAIRNLIAYLGLPYIQLHVEEKSTEKKVLNEQIRAVLRDVPVDCSHLPLLVHEGFKVYDAYPIMAYICRRFGRQDLMGRNIQQRARLLQILAIYFTKQPSNMGDLFTVADQCFGKSQNEVFQIKCAIFEHLMKFSGYIHECCKFLLKQQTPTYVLEEITLIDFTFLESSQYVLGFLGDLDQLLHKLKPTSLPIRIDSLKCLDAMRNYIAFMKNETFYLNNQEYLESKTILSFLFTAERIESIRKVWMGTPNMVK